VPCGAWDVEYALSATLRLSDTPMGQGDGEHPIGPGTLVLRYEDVGGKPGGRVKLVSYQIRQAFSVASKNLFWTTQVATDATTRKTPDACGAAAEGQLTGTSIGWTSPVAGFVTDGMVRDIIGIQGVGLPVYCAGVTPNSPVRNGPGTVGEPVDLGGLRIESGDILIGDRDGVVVVPRERAEAVLAALKDVRAAEAALEAKVKAADALKATGIPLGAPAMVSALRDLDDAAAKDKALAAKAVSFDQDLQDKAAAAASDQLKLTGEISIAGAIVALLVGTTVALIIGRGIVTPIRAMTEAMVALADNNLQTSIPGTERTDEIGDMAKAVLVFKDNAVRAAGIAAEEKAGNAEISAAIARAAENDLTVRVELGSKTGFVRNTGVAINKLLDISSETLAGIDLKTRQVATAVTDASAAIGQVSGGVRDQTGAVNEVARALTESVEAIRLVSESAKVADEKGLAATKLVERSQVLVEQLAQTVETIAQNSRKISQITEVIAGIANRTHILSLNAAIEAARAGEHGKGFVVVAQEVGKLAESAAQNTRQITDIVEQATADVAEGRLASAAVSETMNAIAGEVSQTSQMIRSIAVAMEQQRATVTHIEGNLTDLRGIASGNAAAAEEITTTMIQLSKLADEQRLQLAKFRTA